MLPWLLGAAAVGIGTAIYKAVTSDDDTSSSSSRTVSDESERRQEAEERRQKEVRQQALAELKAIAIRHYEHFERDTGVRLPMDDLKKCPANLIETRDLVFGAIESHCESTWRDDPLLSLQRVELAALVQEAERLMTALKEGR